MSRPNVKQIGTRGLRVKVKDNVTEPPDTSSQYPRWITSNFWSDLSSNHRPLSSLSDFCLRGIFCLSPKHLPSISRNSFCIPSNQSRFCLRKGFRDTYHKVHQCGGPPRIWSTGKSLGCRDWYKCTSVLPRERQPLSGTLRPHHICYICHIYPWKGWDSKRPRFKTPGIRPF